ncbi:hypothetical protein R6Z07_006293 [Ovis aries]
MNCSTHARPPCPSPTPRIHSNSCPSSWSCHPAISSSVVPFSSCPQSLSASESFPTSQLLPQGGQSIGVSVLASVLPKEHPRLISFRMDQLIVPFYYTVNPLSVYVFIYSGDESQSVVFDCLGPHELRSTPGFPVHHQLSESTQIHVHRVGDTIEPSHPLSSLLLTPSIFPSIRVFSNISSSHSVW